MAMATEIEQIRETNTSDASCSEIDTKQKYEIEIKFKEKLLQEFPEVFEYIQKLENNIKKYLKKINKLRNKLKIKTKCTDISTQTNIEEDSTHTIKSTSILDSNTNTQNSLVDEIKEAAEIAMQNTGFVYEETSGLYYDYNTGYYYNAIMLGKILTSQAQELVLNLYEYFELEKRNGGPLELLFSVQQEYGLYYDGTTGKYLQYNAETQAYEFHCQVPVPTSDGGETRTTKRKQKHKHKTKDKKKARIGEEDAGPNVGDVEEGECTTSDASTDDGGVNSDTCDISKSWPPCMRIIVEASEIPSMKVGSLHIVTCSGGTVGREGAHSILLKDLSASKHHLKITFDEKSGQYQVVDLGSRNGTLLNGKRMSPSKQESETMAIVHGSRIQIGQTVLACHIHEGNQTCGHCEPGLIQSKEPEKEKIYKHTKLDSHKKELNNLKMLFGVKEYDGDTKLATGYTDRAQQRRKIVGSQNPHEKTQVASLDESINKENKGFKLLQKMGWKEGQSLGKDGDGLLEPIKLKSNEGNAGIGSTNIEVPLAPSEIKKQNIWKKTNERFQKLPESNNAFDADSDD